MITINNTSFEVRESWNRYMRKNVLEVNIDGKWCMLGALTYGKQKFAYGIVSNTTTDNNYKPIDCDLIDAKTELTIDCE